jgi:hypothetical protein
MFIGQNQMIVRPDPAILFNVSLARRSLHADLPAVVDALSVYHLIPDSVWINSALLAPNAPPDRDVRFSGAFGGDMNAPCQRPRETSEAKGSGPTKAISRSSTSPPKE